MKRKPGNFKGLHEYGHAATNTGHAFTQPGQPQGIAFTNIMHEQAKTFTTETTQTSSANQTITEQEQNSGRTILKEMALSVELLTSDLETVVIAWQRLPTPMKTGIAAMVKAVLANMC